jgi:hypothetical protein
MTRRSGNCWVRFSFFTNGLKARSPPGHSALVVGKTLARLAGNVGDPPDVVLPDDADQHLVLLLAIADLNADGRRAAKARFRRASP